MEIVLNGAKQLGISLNNNQTEKFGILYRELIDWNKNINLTAITDYDEVITKHFLDSLTVIAAHRFSNLDRVIDIGTGAGFPGLPLIIAFPYLNLTLLEATAKKVSFLHHIIQTLELHVDIIGDRAETAAHQPEHREKYDVVLSRAVAELPVAVELCLPYCKMGGMFIAQKKGDIAEEISSVKPAIEILGGRLKEIIPVTLSDLPEGRQLVVIEKISPTPDKYPRRPGMPEKRPIK